MKFILKPLASLNGFVLAGLLATVGASALAQGAPAAAVAGPTATGQPAGHRMGHHDPAQLQSMMAKRQAEMKVKLQLTPAQEGAWTNFTAAMQPPAYVRPTPEQRAELYKLATPQRIDRMKELRTQRTSEMNAAVDKRGEATKRFYAVLSPDQQKTFDAEHKKHAAHHDSGHHAGRGAKG